MNIEILPLNGAVKYLGRKVSFENFQGVEIQHRVQAAWAKFMSSKDELTGKQYALKQRLRLFDAVVSPTVLYGCETWSLRKRDEQFLRCTQRKMLRMIFGAKRRIVSSQEGTGAPELEPWVDWIKRATHAIENEMSKMNMTNWIQHVRFRKWNYYGRVLAHDMSRWTRIVHVWNPALHLDGPCFRSIQCSRAQARPKTRWIDELSKFALNLSINERGLMEMRSNRLEWQSLGKEFCKDDWRTPSSEEQDALDLSMGSSTL